MPLGALWLQWEQLARNMQAMENPEAMTVASAWSLVAGPVTAQTLGLRKGGVAFLGPLRRDSTRG